MFRTLLLMPSYTPLKAISWQMAVRLVYQDKAEVVESYDEEISSPSVTWKMPAVIRLKRSLPVTKRGIKFSRINVMSRDKFRCQYCGERKVMRELNYDHVVPRMQGGKTNWANVVSSCYFCNGKKGNRTPEQAGMKLLNKPFRPKSLPMTYMAMDRRNVPEIWKPYVPEGDVHEDNGTLFLMTGTSK